MRNKKGQITIAIILAVILLISVALMLYLRPKEIEAVERILIDVPEMARPVAIYVQNCVDVVATPGVYLLGVQGGYVFPPEDSLETYYGKTYYGYKEGINALPGRTEMEFQLSAYMDAAITSCANLSTFERQGFEIIEDAITTTTIIAEDNVIIRIKWPIRVKKGDFETTFEEFATEVPVRLGKMHSIAQSVVAKQVEDPEFLDISHMSSFDIPVETVPIDTEHLLISIVDNTTLFEGEPFAFMFANKYIFNQDPTIIVDDEFVLQDEQPFSYQVNATDPEGDALTFKDYTHLFDINETTGMINFTPQIPGEYDVELKVTDSNGNEDKKFVRFIVS